MAEFPFQLSIKKNNGDKDELVTCRSILRTVRENRFVYEGAWQDRDVIIKVFSKGLAGRRRLNREWQGLVKLRELGVNCPKALFWGKTVEGGWAAVQEKINNAFTVFF